MRTITRPALAVTALSAATLLTVTHAKANNNVVGYVYVNDNTEGTNTVAAYARLMDGSLAALPGSPFSAGAQGGVGLGSEGSIQVTTGDKKFLLVVDGAGDAISVFSINHDGSLTLVGSPVPSGGVMPVSLTINGNIVYVANRGDASGGANYTGFTLSDNGALEPIAGSTVPIAGGATADVGEVLFSPDGKTLIGTEIGTVAGTFLIDSFTVKNNLLRKAPGSPFAAQGAGPFGSDFGGPHTLYVTNAHDGTGLGTISAFNVDNDGVLTSLGGSPYVDLQTAPCWLKVSPDGQIAYAVNTGSSTISRYSLKGNGTPTLLGSTPFLPIPTTAAIKVTDPGFDPSGQFFYVVDGSGYLSAFTVATNGNLGEIVSSPIALPAGATPSSLVVIQQ